MTSHHLAAPEPERSETVALLALLRAAPGGVRWGDIAQEVKLSGSAQAVLDRVRGADAALFPDPALDDAVRSADVELGEWERDGLDLVTVLSGRYPHRLASVFDCPPFLFARGLVVPEDRGMSVVGSRNASPKGLALARCAAGLLAERGLTVVSGLAEGIDAAAHREALALGARTVAVLGTGIRRSYPPANRGLQEQIAARGLIISQFYPDQPPTKTTFPMRNVTMSGYGLATIVADAGEHSGSRIQARRAADHGRRVILSARVVANTRWGAEMASEPGVAVAGSERELADGIDQVLADSAENLLKTLGLALV
ncbi:MAG: DNA-protecting protein DprA [Bifidobacteriaceae bacterium]|jgi:DNA processing protein|nr:DNA-protecting protein DprA [Bifidobacteriaceae bacterium]